MSPSPPSPLAKFGDALAARAALFGSIAIVAAVPFVVVPALYVPTRGQGYFLKIAAFVALAAWAVGRAIGSPRRGGWTIPQFAVALGCGAVAASALTAKPPRFVLTAPETRGLLPPSAAYSLDSALLPLAGAALFVLLIEVARTRSLRRLFGPILVAQAGILAAYGLLQEMGVEVLAYSGNVPKNRIIATFGHPNFFGSFMGPALFVCLAFAAGARSRAARFAGIGAAGLVAIALLLARTRAVWIGAAGGLVATAALVALARPAAARELLRGRRAVLAAGAALVALALAGGLAGSESWRRLARLDPGSQWENRLAYWRTATLMGPTLAPLGVGHGGFGRAFWWELDRLLASEEGPLYRRNLVALTGEGGALDPGHAHNDYLEMRAESGPFALFAHLAFVGYLLAFGSIAAIRRGRAAPPDAGEFAAALRAIAVAAPVGGFVCAAIDAAFGFPLALPCSLVLFQTIAATLHESIHSPRDEATA